MRLQIILLPLIIILAIFFRFNNLNWDSNFHLHPDERFLTMVGGAMQIPNNIADYLDPSISTFNPANIDYKFYVYGTFPVVINKIAAVLLHKDNYNDFTLLGRFLSALADLFIIFFIYKTVELLEKKHKISSSIKYWASFFYAISVYPIQASHFFTTDTFLNFFVFASFCFALKFYYHGRIRNLIFSAVFTGLAIASKISAVYILPLILFLIITACLSFRPERSGVEKSLSNITKRFLDFARNDKLQNFLLILIIYTSFIYLTIRFADPYIFATSNIFDPRPNTVFMNNLKELTNLSSGKIWYPPAVQWYGTTPILFSLKNIAFFSLGLPYFIFLMIGFYAVLKKKKIELIVICLWIIIFFLYQSTQFVKSIRYFLILCPFFAIFAGFGLEKGMSYLLRVMMIKKNVTCYMLYVTCIILLLIWPLAFSSIYFHKNSRVQASEWIYQNLPNNAVILSEYWDDPMPMSVENNSGKQFRGYMLPVFDPDTKEKWDKMNGLLKQADYYILSSNRGWGSIPTVPEKYPQMSKFYEDLLNSSCHPERAKRVEGSYCYKKIKEFISYPSLKYLGIPIDFPDQWSEEAFTVYDHPQVIIFNNAKNTR